MSKKVKLYDATNEIKVLGVTPEGFTIVEIDGSVFKMLDDKTMMPHWITSRDILKSDNTVNTSKSVKTNISKVPEEIEEFVLASPFYIGLLNNGANPFNCAKLKEEKTPKKSKPSAGEGKLKPKTDVEIFREIVNQMADTFEAKNNDYGNSTQDTYDKFGDVSFLTRLTDKLNRLTTLCTGTEQKVKDESIDDTIIDLAVYAVIFKMTRQKR